MKKHFDPIKCLLCGKEFTPTRHDAKYCSRFCGNKYRCRLRPRKTAKSYLKANELKNNPLTEEELQVLYGALLGDGTIVHTPHGFRFSLCQSETQLPYLLWKKSQLPNIMMANPCRYEKEYKGYHTTQYHLHSIHHPGLEKVYNLFYKDGTKTVTTELLNKLKPLALAVWYMDDGSFNKNPNSQQIFWSTDSFTKEENGLIIDWFHNRLDIETKLQPMGCGGTFGNSPTFRIRINRSQTGKFFDLIRPYVHPTMLYKIK